MLIFRRCFLVGLYSFSPLHLALVALNLFISTVAWNALPSEVYNVFFIQIVFLHLLQYRISD